MSMRPRDRVAPGRLRGLLLVRRGPQGDDHRERTMPCALMGLAQVQDGRLLAPKRAATALPAV